MSFRHLLLLASRLSLALLLFVAACADVDEGEEETDTGGELTDAGADGEATEDTGVPGFVDTGAKTDPGAKTDTGASDPGTTVTDKGGTTDDGPVVPTDGKDTTTPPDLHPPQDPGPGDTGYERNPPAPGQVIITEIMKDPDASYDEEGEWFEVTNVGSKAADLDRCYIHSEGDTPHRFDSPGGLFVQPNGYLVIGKSYTTADNGGYMPDYVMEGITLGNGQDYISIVCQSEEIDRVAYDNGARFPDVRGSALQLMPSALDGTKNDEGENWCAAAVTYGAGDRGTPGEANPECPDPCELMTCDQPPAPECEGDVAKVYGLTGTCAAGECSYAVESSTNCAETQRVCRQGICLDPASTSIPPGVGDIVITEIHKNPDAAGDSKGEWFEVINVSEILLDLNGCKIGSTNDSPQTIENGDPLHIAPDTFMVFGRNDNQSVNGGVEVDYAYGTLHLGNDDDALWLSCDGQEIDRVRYHGGFPGNTATSMQLDSETYDATANDDGNRWCDSIVPYGDGDLGTPGEPNRDCDKDPCDGVTCQSPPDPECEGDLARTFEATGSCSNGRCSYSAASEVSCTDSSQVCSDGACVDACTLMVCDDPPAADCKDGVARSYKNPGTCEAGECSYAVDLEDNCTTRGWVCAGGMCVDLCENVVCDDPPAPDCEGDTARTFADAGTCGTGNCSYAVEGTTNCTTEQKVCRDGECIDPGVTAPAPQPGEVVFSEVMYNSESIQDPVGEWFELRSLAPIPLDLGGCALGSRNDDDHDITTGEPLIIEPGGHLVFGQNAAPGSNGGVTVDYAYTGSARTTGGDSLSLSCSDSLVDEVVYDDGGDFPEAVGASISLDPGRRGAEENDDGRSWCLGTTAYGAGDFGTPGEDNHLCPNTCVDVPCDTPPSPDCQGETARIFANPGICTFGMCAYPPALTTSCAEQNLVCSRGACVEPESRPTAPRPGDLVISEVMFNPDEVHDSRAEWIELASIADGDLDLDGCRIESSGDPGHVISAGGPLLLQPNALLVLGNNGDTSRNGGVTQDYTYSGVVLGNGSDSLTIRCDAIVVDTVTWDHGVTFPDTKGKAMQLDPDAFDPTQNDTGSNWCDATQRYGDGDKGTPGSPNSNCN